MKRHEIHVVHVRNENRRKWWWRWATIRGNGKRHRYFDSKTSALAHARHAAKRFKLEVVIHRTDGSIMDSDTYGHEGKVKDRVH